MDRYQHVERLLNALAGRTDRLNYLEVGTYDGVRTARRLRHWEGLSPKKTATLYAFDLWEAMDQQTNDREFSKKRLPPSRHEVQARLEASTERTHAILHPGNTLVTLPKAVPFLPRMDLIFVDGGHALATVANDWHWCSKLMGPETVVLLDDYYENRADVGCRPLVDGLRQNPKLAVTLLDPLDVVPVSGLEVRMVEVRLARP